MKKPIIFIFSLIITILTSCMNSKYNIQKKEYWGVVQTCIVDSTSITIDSIVKLKIRFDFNSTKPSFKNQNCVNRPSYADSIGFWPSYLRLNFKEKEYSFLHSPEPFKGKTQSPAKGIKIAYKLDSGILIYNKNNNTWTLQSKINNWTRTFNVIYSKQDSIMTLKNKNGYKPT